MSTSAVGDSIIFIGAGNVASHLAPALERSGAGHVVQVYSRNIASARGLASALENAVAIDDQSQVIPDADVYIVSLVDHAVSEVLSRIPRNKALWLHTSGSLPMDVLESMSGSIGVFYPLQTFSKGVDVDMAEVPLFIEGSSPEVADRIRRIAERVTPKVHYADGDLRKRMHIAAVFACNFTNHMFTIADDLLRRDGLSLEVLHPLLKETVRKALNGSPAQGQTGPAVRGDREVMEAHESMLDPQLAEIYRMISASIYNRHHKS